MIQFKLNKKPIQVPSCWEDLTFAQSVEIMKGREDIISILTGIDHETLKNARIEGLETLLQCLSFLKKPYVVGAPCTEIGGYKLPINSKGEFNIQLESLGQFEDMRKAMASVPEKDVVKHTLAYADYVAIYLQKLRDGVYSLDKASSMVPEVMQMRGVDVISLGSFFFLKLWSLSTGTALSSLSTTQVGKKKRPDSKTSKKSSGRTPLSRKSRKR